MHPRLSGLWRHPDFMRLWLGQSVSLFGSQITLLALPLTAVLNLHASPGQMGLLAAAGTAPILLVGLLAGVWVDRYRRRPLLVATNIGRALVLALIPLAAVLDVLSIELLYFVATVAGLLTVFFDVAYVSYLPGLIAPDQLVDGNSKLQVSYSAAQAAGPGLAGALVQLIGAPLAIAFDACSFACAALSLLLIHKTEPAPATRATGQHWRDELADGLHTLWTDSLLRTLVIWGALFNVCSAAIDTVYLFYVTRDLGITPERLGLILALAGIGGLLGALEARRVVKALGLGRALIVSALVVSASCLLIPLSTDSSVLSLALLVTAGFTGRFAIAILSINLMTIQQAAAPSHMLGRVNAATRVIITGALPLGGLLGGLLGERIGVRATLLTGALGALLSLLWLWRSPLQSFRQPPNPAAPPGLSAEI